MNHASSALTLREILRQPSSWTEAIAAVDSLFPRLQTALSGDNSECYLFTGCGSSYYLAIAAAAFFQEITGLTSRPVPASELILSARSHIPAGKRCVLFAFSRSGETTETVVAIRRYREWQCGPAIGFTCRATSTMQSVVDLNVSLPAADDNSIVMTSSFTSMLLASVYCGTRLEGNDGLAQELCRLPGLLTGQLVRQEMLGRRLGEDLSMSRFVFLGIGPFFGLALEAMLKLKEMTQVPCEAYSPLEFRHGPISIIEPGTMAVLLGSDRANQQELAVLDTVGRLGGRTLLLGGDANPRLPVQTFGVGEGLVEPVRALLYMPLLQCLAYYRALAVGCDPDQPQHLTQVVTLNEADLVSG